MNDLKQLLNELYSTYVAGNLVKAEEIALRALELDPTSDYAHMILALAYKRLDNIEDSLKYFDLAKDMARKNGDMLLNYAVVKSLNNQNEEALEMFELLLKNMPDFELAWYNYAYCLLIQQKWTDALNAFNKAEKSGFVGKKLYAFRGMCYYNLKNYLLAERDYNKAIEQNPNDLGTSYNLAETYMAKAEWKKAVEQFSIIINKDIKYSSAMGRRLLARVNIKDEKGNIKNHKLAQAEADKIVELGLPFMKYQDKDGNPFKITKIDIGKDGSINPFVIPINPKK